MAGYASRVQDDIRRWRDAGLIDAPTAGVLSRDIEVRSRSRLSFGSILAIFAALLFAAGLLIFVAADWDAIPRLVRVGGVALLILFFTLGGALLKAAGRTGFAEASWLAGSAAWGASIILVGRMYGLPPDDDALLIWCLGTAFAALVLPSATLTVAASALAFAWLLARAPGWMGPGDLPLFYPLLVLGIWLVSLRSRSRQARELLLLSTLAFVFFLAQRYGSLLVGGMLAASSSVLFALAVFRSHEAEKILRVDGRAPVFLLLGGFLGFALVQGEFLDRAGFTVSAGVILAAIAAALLLGGRGSAGVRRLCYTAFAAEICIVFGVTVGSALGTTGFFLLAAVCIAGLAVAVFRIERRWQLPVEAGAGP